MSLRGVGVDELFERARNGDRRAVGRLLTLVERAGADADRLTALAHPHVGNAHVIGITGPPGAGKSTLVGQFVAEAAARGKHPAVLAVDPSSPLTGGAILGDRIRIDQNETDAFVRSVATRGHSGGLALSVPGSVRVFDAAGYDPVIIETVGVGQVEVDVTATADTTVVVANPGTGDAVQANKAGLLEVADVFVVNKADRPGADDVRRDLELMLDLSHATGADARSGGLRTPIVMTDSLEGKGIPELWDAVSAHLEHLVATDELAARRALRTRAEVRSRVEAALSKRLDEAMAAPSAAEVLARCEGREIAPTEAAGAIVDDVLG
ncbi:MAG: methylmalonyl Co-A mutase-associated GTPase MeaB [Acidimicrobiales bacterium]